MTIELTVLISLATAVGGFALSWFSHRRATRKEASEDGKTDGVLLTDMGYVKAGIDDIKREQREQTKTNIEVLTRLTAVEASAKQAHKRIDAMGGPHA